MINEARAFSTHHDDLIFSIGGTLEKGIFEHMDAHTVFSRSNFTKEGIGKVKEVTQARKEENRVVLSRVGINIYDLEFDDAPLRLSTVDEKSYINPLFNPENDVVTRKVRRTVDSLINGTEEVILFPLGLGYHRDHTIVASVGAAYHNAGYPVVFYEDVGYEVTEDDERVSSHVRNFAPGLANIVMPIDIGQKLLQASTYKTQITPEYITHIERTARKRGGERLWMSPALVSKF